MAETYQIQSEELYPADIWSWTEELSDYPASDNYTLMLTLRQGDVIERIAATTNADGKKFDFSVLQVKTQRFLGGYCEFQYQIAKSTTVLKTIVRGGLEIKPNLILEESDINFWQRQYNKAKTLYNALTERKVSKVTINGRSIEYDQRAELTAIMAEAKIMVEKLSGKRITKLKVRFQRT